MRLLMVGPWRADSMRRQIDWAVESGIEVMAADLRPYDQYRFPAAARRAALLPAQSYAIRRTVLNGQSWPSVMIGALRLRALARVFQPHVIHSYMIGYYTDVCLQAQANPLVVSAWGWLNEMAAGRESPQERQRLRKLRSGAHTLVVDNPNLFGALARMALDPLQVVYAPMGVDSGLFHPGYEETAAGWRFVLDIPPEATVLLSPRGWSATYGQQHIMEAFAQAHRQLDGPLVLVLRGLGRMKRPERLAQEVHDLGVRLGVGHAIRWIPTVPFEDLPGVYALADIVVNYPCRDAFPSTLLEAAACSRPVITSALPAYRNTFIEHFCRLVEPENPAALADAIVEVAHAKRALWAARADEARGVVLAEYEEGLQKQRLIALYRAIAEEQAARGKRD